MTSQVTSQSTREADKEGEGNKVGGGLEDLGEKGRRGKVRREVRLATVCPVSGPQRVWSRVPPQVGDLPSTPCCCLVIAPSRALWHRQPAPSGPISLRGAAGLSPADSGPPLALWGVCVCGVAVAPFGLAPAWVAGSRQSLLLEYCISASSFSLCLSLWFFCESHSMVFAKQCTSTTGDSGVPCEWLPLSLEARLFSGSGSRGLSAQQR